MLKLPQFAVRGLSSVRTLKLPLAARIILPLIAVLLIFLPLSGVLLVNRIQDTRHQELLSLLQGQADLVEESLELAEGVLKEFEDQDYIQQLNWSARSLLWITNKRGEQIYISAGPEDSTRNAVVAEANAATDQVFPKIITLDDEIWMITRTHPKLNVLQKELAQVRDVYSGINITQTVEHLDSIKHNIFIITSLTCLVACLAVVATVSLSTFNLRFFTRSISQINPNNPKWSFDRKARSLEESQLFSTFQSMIEKIAEAKESQRLFIANASHELKTPVAGILAAMEVALSKDRSKEEYRDICKGVLQTARDMKRLTGAMLDLAAFEHHAYPMQAIAVQPFVKGVVDRWNRVAAARGIQIKVSSTLSETRSCKAHPELFDVAISNFLDNAIKYSHDGGAIVVQLSAVDDGKSKICIRDQGKGMSAATQERLGELFHMGDSSRTKVSSYGLGYAQAKRIIETFGGTLSIKSDLGVGTEITIVL